MKKIYNKKQIYNALDIDINLRDGGSMNPKSMTGLIDNIIVNGNGSGSSDSLILFDIFGGQQPYVWGIDGELQALVPLTADEIPGLIKDREQHRIYYREQPTTYCASSFAGATIMSENEFASAIIMNDASEFLENPETNYWYYEPSR